jgi:hypothetical protein
VFDQTDNNIPDGLCMAMLELKVIETDQNSCAVEARSDSHHRLSLHVASWPVTSVGGRIILDPILPSAGKISIASCRQNSAKSGKIVLGCFSTFQ